jgi:hypothetical protein
MKTVYDSIKKQNGQQFANTIRKQDSGIFDVPNLLQILKFAGRDAVPLLPYLNSLKDIKIEEVKSTECPFKLLEQAGYIAELADTHEKHNKIARYYAPGEKVCFLGDPGRPKSHYIINAVKKDIDAIIRGDFQSPRREDRYGTSVISIHILKEGGVICITNRYNHTVEHPDNTFESNPDNIIYGLSPALKSHFDVDFSSDKLSPPNGYILVKKQIIKYNYEINGVYYGDGFYVYNGKITELDPNSQIMLDYFIFDTNPGTYRFCQNQVLRIDEKLQDSFRDVLQTELAGEKPGIGLNESKNKCIMIDDRIIVETKEGKIISASFGKSETVGTNFLHRNYAMTGLHMPNVPDLIFSENILSDNGYMVGKLYHDYAMSLRKKHINR